MLWRVLVAYGPAMGLVRKLLGRSVSDTSVSSSRQQPVTATASSGDPSLAGLAAQEVQELAGGPIVGRELELAQIAAIDGPQHVVDSETLCLAAVIDRPGTDLMGWPRFMAEKRLPPTRMWDDALQNETPPAAPAPIGMSFEARLVLCDRNAFERQVPMSRSEVRDRFVLTPQCCDEIVDELMAHQLCHLASLKDQVARMTVAEMDPILTGVEVRASWSKARKIEAAFNTLTEQEVRSRLLETRPKVLEADLLFGPAVAVDISYHRAWARLAGHFIQFCAYRDRDFQELQSQIRDGIIGPSEVTVQVLPAPDSCESCKNRPSRPSVSDVTTWPPFHLGCRCATVLDF
jgi:hypothetical protein